MALVVPSILSADFTRLGEVGHVAFRLDNHEMSFEGQRRRAADGLDHQRANGDVGHEAAVHHVNL